MNNFPAKPLLASLLFAAALTAGATAAHAQSDNQVWTEVGTDAELTDDLELGFEQHLRFDQDASRVMSVMPELGLEYAILDWLDFSAGYRLEYERTGSGDFETAHRFTADAEAKRDLGPLEFAYRLRGQEKLDPKDQMLESRHTVRNRFGVGYEELGDWEPEAEVETFHSFGDDDGLRLRKLRLTFGTSYDFGKPEASVFYRVELPQEDDDDPTLHIFGFGFHYGL